MSGDPTSSPYRQPPPPRQLSGDEQFDGMGDTVMDFWRWAHNDLRDNVQRGFLAEWLVARAVGANAHTRVNWDNYDVLTPSGVRVEVKASGYCQSWAQRGPSRISFGHLTGRAWDSTSDTFGDEREHRADVFVFAIQTCKEPDQYDVLDVGQWEFRVVHVDALRGQGGRSISIGVLDRLAPRVCSWTELADAIEEAAGRGSEPPN